MKTPPRIIQLELGDMANFTYLLGDPATGEATVIDPGADIPDIEAAAINAGLKVKSVLLTHGHYDHVGGVGHYDRQGCPVYISADEFGLYVPRCRHLQRLRDGDTVAVGGLTVSCLATPGHSPGGLCFLADNNLFSGDTLFVEAIGRTDFPGGNAKDLFASLQRIKQLPDNTMIWPGHNYGDMPHAPLAALKAGNPYLACANAQEFLAVVG